MHINLVCGVLHWAGAEAYVPKNWPGLWVQRLCMWKQERVYRYEIRAIGKGKNHASERGPGAQPPHSTNLKRLWTLEINRTIFE